jgi:hypothetical protein
VSKIELISFKSITHTRLTRHARIPASGVVGFVLTLATRRSNATTTSTPTVLLLLRLLLNLTSII